MTPCIIESPYAGFVDRNKAYLQLCIRWCIAHGMTPYASHQMLTDALDDRAPAARQLGLAVGWDMTEALIGIGAEVLFFVDLGWSPGMELARDRLDARGVPYRLVTGVA
jgi:hypothetical protein